MKLLSDENKLNYYMKKYELDMLFENNIKEYMQLLAFDIGESVITKGEMLEYVYFLVEGKVKVYTIVESGRVLLFDFYEPLNVVGEADVFHDHIPRCNVQAITKTICIAIPINLIKDKAYKEIKLITFLCEKMSEKFLNGTTFNSINMLYPLENRLANYILTMASEMKDKDATEICIYKLTEIADLLATSYRHLLRTIKKLVDKGIIDKKEKTIVILDKKKLQELAKEANEV